MKISIEAQTDVGRVRELNEDSFRVVPQCNAVIVCDGMGGHAAGEVASSAAAETIADLVLEKPAPVAEPIFPQLDRPMPADAVMLAGAVRVANRRLHSAAAKSPQLRGMGTTVVAAVFSDGVVATAHVGDSRAYRIANGQIEQLTIDHSWIAELVQSGQVKPEDAESFADKNVITRALGTRPNVQVDVGLYPTQDGELYLLCSDGVCGYVSDPDILEIVTRYQEDLSAAAAGLIDAANAAGGLDNSTVALVRIEASGQAEEEYRTGAITLPEESDAELQTIDEIIESRYPAGQLTPQVSTGTTPVAPPVAEPLAVEIEEETEETEAEGRGVPWGWLFLGLVAVAIVVTFIWPGLLSGPADDPVNVQDSPIEATTPADESATVTDVPESETQRPPLVPPVSRPESAPSAAAVRGEGLIYLVAWGDRRNTGVYWDGVYQGRVGELEVGMLVDQGEHRLVVVTKANDTILDRSLTILPNDTLDIEVQ